MVTCFPTPILTVDYRKRVFMVIFKARRRPHKFHLPRGGELNARTIWYLSYLKEKHVSVLTGDLH